MKVKKMKTRNLHLRYHHNCLTLKQDYNEFNNTKIKQIKVLLMNHEIPRYQRKRFPAYKCCNNNCLNNLKQSSSQIKNNLKIHMYLIICL